VITIAKSIFSDLLLNRILYNVLFISVGLLFLGYLAALLVFGHQNRVMIHLGSFLVALSIYSVGIGVSAQAIRNSIEDRTLYLVLARGVPRTQILLGTWMGMFIFLLLNILLLSGVLGFGIHQAGGQLNLAWFQSMSLLWSEAGMWSALALALSFWLSPGLVWMTIGTVIFLSHNPEQLQYLSSQGASGLGVLSRLLPNGQNFLMGTKVFYHEPLKMAEWAVRMSVGFAWSVFYLLLANWTFSRKNL
jgi:hypothetical protein